MINHLHRISYDAIELGPEQRDRAQFGIAPNDHPEAGRRPPGLIDDQFAVLDVVAERHVPGADLQAGFPRRFPFAHGAGRASHRRWVSGRHCSATCSVWWRPRTVRLFRFKRSYKACRGSIFQRWGCRRLWRAASCSAIGLPHGYLAFATAVVGTIAASARFHFAERGITVIGPPVPGGCRRSSCLTRAGAKPWRCCQLPLHAL